MDIEALKQGLQGAKVEDVPIEVQQDALGTIIDNIETNEDIEVDDDVPEIATQTQDAIDEIDTDEKLVSHFAKQIGYDGEVQGSGLDALLYITKQQLKASEEIANDDRVKEFLAVVKQGGTLQDYQAMQPTNDYGEIELDESDTEFTTKVVRECLIKLYNFDSEKQIDKYITNLKDEGELFGFAEENLTKLQKREQDENRVRKQTVEAELIETAKEAAKYYKELGSAFDNGITTGVIVDKAHLATIKQMSLPDKQNKLGIEAVLNELKPEQVAAMNTLAWCLKNKQSFQFNPNATTVKPTTKPIIGILDKGKSTAQQSKRSLGETIKSKMNNN